MQLKNLIQILIFLVLPLAGSAQQIWTDHSRLLPDQLRGLQTGILITHDPTPVYPEINLDTVDYPGKYIWKHQTTASSLKGDLTVLQAGSFIWRADKGWVANIRLDKQSFAKYFNCPGAVLRKGKTYTFLKNWRYGDVAYAGDALWFIIAKAPTGRLFKGIAVVETEGLLNKALK